MNKKGFAVSGILYTLLLITLIMITMMLYNLQNRKTILDQLKIDAVSAVEQKNDISYLKEEIERINTRLDNQYPVGSIYISTSNTNPSNFLGGTWEVYGTGKTLVGADGSTYKAGSTGGSSSVTLTTANLPSHTHSIPALSGTAASAGDGMSASVSSYANVYREGWTSGNGSHSHNFSKGGEAIVIDSSTTLIDYGLGIGRGGPDQVWSNHNKNQSGIAGVADHSHTVGYYDYYANGIAISGLTPHTHSVSTNASTSGGTGSGTSFSVQNPYVVVYMWKRVS